ncbi:MAG: DUF1616 domain-containing protein [Candidatus Lokiarchaeota archaeon]|nr:DUF1616 domain-containing protein [Candidatus Lokiarchaeota archaeon]
MKKLSIIKNKFSSSNNSKSFGKVLTVCLLIGIITVFGFIIYYLTTPEEGFIVFAVLNEEEELGNYPTKALVDENLTFYLYMENHLGYDLKFRIKYGACNNDTWIDPTTLGCSNTTLAHTTGNYTIHSSHKWGPMPVNVSFSEAGNDQMVLFEIWKIFSDEHEEFLFVENGFFLRINLNITTT